MKNLLYTAVLLAVSFTGFTQVGIGTSTPHASAVLEIESTALGFLPPRMDTAQRNLINTPAEGLTIYNTNDNCLNIYDGAAWANMCADFSVVVSTTGKFWMDRNLGATMVSNQPRSAFGSDAEYVSSQEDSFGDFYQWGRGADGHEKRNSPTIGGYTTPTSVTTANPGHGDFILVNGNWTTFQAGDGVTMTLWQGVNGINNPCPAGFRIPTQTEFVEELASWTSQNRESAFSSALKLPAAGRRENFNGTLHVFLGERGYYWSSTVSTNASAYRLRHTSGHADNFRVSRSRGYSVRCIKE